MAKDIPISGSLKPPINFEALFEFANIGILVTDLKGLIQAINPFALAEFGYSESELLGREMEILLPNRVRSKHVPLRNGFIANPQNRPMGIGRDLFALRKDGSEFAVEVSIGNYTFQDSKFFIAFISNITVRKKAEEEIIQLNNELESKVMKRTQDLTETLKLLTLSGRQLVEATSFQNAIVENARIMILATDAKGLIKIFNPEASRNLGYSAKEIQELASPVLFFVPSEIENLRTELREIYSVNPVSNFDVLVEKPSRKVFQEEQFTFVRKDGSRFPVSLSISPSWDASGSVTGFMFVASDISERKKFEENLQESLRKEKELSELKMRFISMASHEFRTPLSTVLSSAYLIEKYTTTGDQPKRIKHVERIVSSINLLTTILNDFLNLGKIEEGKIQVRFSHFNLESEIEQICSELGANLKKGQHLSISYSGNPQVYLDPILIKHILLNLISNASKFSEPGSPIYICCYWKGDSLVLSVRDEGMGISEEDQKHLMERFFRGSNALNIEGTGLGLHIVSKYAELMNGRMEFYSKLEKGTEFTLTFDPFSI